MPTRGYVFVSYSTREEHIQIFLDCLEQVIGVDFEIRKTPEILEASQSQLAQIIEAVGGCALGIVLLDGLRPNVVFEYGLLTGMRSPTLLFLEKDATADIRGFHSVEPSAEVRNVPMNVDCQFSDIKDQFIIKWNRYDPKATRQVLREQIEKKRAEIERRLAQGKRA